LSFPEDRFFGPDAQQKEIAGICTAKVADLPIVSPHGHVDPRLFTDPDYSFGTPVDMLIIPDHYVFRMLYSQGSRWNHWASPGEMAGPWKGITARSGKFSPSISTFSAARPPAFG
jgi:glucuronate isomerase